MIIGGRQPELLLEPRNVFGKAIRFACQMAITLTLGQVITLDKTGIDRLAYRRYGQLTCDLLWFSEDNSGIDLHQPLIFAHFRRMCI